MAFDGAFLHRVLEEIRPLAVGSRVDKIYMPSKNSLVFALRSKGFNGKLLLSAESGTARIQLTQGNFENPAVPPMLCMLLRKKLVGAKLTALRQPALERIVYLDFDTRNELGDPVVLTLVAELMGRNTNLILLSEQGKVIDSVRRTDAADTTRIVMPGVTYTPPQRSGEYDLLTMPPAMALQSLAGEDRRNIAKGLLQAVPGISPIVCRELTHRSLKGAEDEPMTDPEKQILEEELCKLQTLLTGHTATPVTVTDKNGKPVDFTFFPVTQYGQGATVTPFSTFCGLLDEFYSKRDQKARLQAKSQTIHKFLNTTVARLTRTVNLRTAELEKAKNCEQLREFGELIKANLHLITPGSQGCRVINYYDPECKEITIPLSPALSPAANAGKYFKEYRKKCTAAGMLQGLIEQALSDITYLESVQEALSRVETTAEIAAIEQELIQSGWLKNKHNKKGKVQAVKELPPHKFRSPDGFTVLAGRNNRQNDKLTLKLAEKNDIWFHTKTIPGSHVIIKTEGKEVPDSTMTFAAVIAATLSSGADSTGVAVDYCPVKRVKKPNGAPPGMVIYETYNTAFVNPDKTLLQTHKEE